MESFFNILSGTIRLTPESRDALSAIARVKEVGKGTLLVREGSVCPYVYYIERGLTRTFYDKEGKDITDWISMDGDFAVSIVSFLTGMPDRRGIETLEPCLLYAFHHDDLERLYDRYHPLERLGRMLVSQGLIQMQQRFDALHFATARERYARLLAEKPDLLLRVPLGILASFLGITQETLSRIRSQV